MEDDGERATALSWEECSGASKCLVDGTGVIVVGVREASGRAGKKEVGEGVNADVWAQVCFGRHG